MDEVDAPVLYTFTNEVIAGVDVFRPGVVFRVSGQGLSPLVVDMERDSGAGSQLQLGEKVLEPQALLARVGK